MERSVGHTCKTDIVILCRAIFRIMFVVYRSYVRLLTLDVCVCVCYFLFVLSSQHLMLSEIGSTPQYRNRKTEL